mgnify:CR=1 FL=1
MKLSWDADALDRLAYYLECMIGKPVSIDHDRKIVVVDLFSGGGGFTTGAVQAGAVVALSIDCWEPAGKVHEDNHPNVPHLTMFLGPELDDDYNIVKEADIDYEVELIKSYVQPYIDAGYHFHLHGSPPCQDLSNASRGDPERGMILVMHFLELVDRLEPHSWSMENVPPLKKRLQAGVSCVPATIINSAELGIPQQRRRCFAGEGWDITKTHSNHNLKGNKNKHLPNFRSVIDALPHLQEEYIELLRGYSRTRPVMEDGVYTGRHTPRIPPDGCIDITEDPSYAICGSSLELWGRVIELAEGAVEMLINTVGGGESGGDRVCSVDTPIDDPCKTLNNNMPSIRLRAEAVMDAGRGNSVTSGVNPATGEQTGGKGPLYRSLDNPSYTITSSNTTIGMTINNASVTESNSPRALSSDVDIADPSNTITGREVTVRSNVGDGVNYRKVRSLTIDEMAALQDFPSNYSFDTKYKKDRTLIVGNAVCPGVAKAVIEGIKIGGKEDV